MIPRTNLASRRHLVALGLSLGMAWGSLCAGEPLAVTGRRGWVSGTTGVLIEPTTGAPVALIDDPNLVLPPERRQVVLETEVESASGAAVPRLRVVDSLPEFWAQPSVWRHFTKGVGAASGFGRDLQPRDWAGRPASDRRAYPLDRGIAKTLLPEGLPTQPGIGAITLTANARTVFIQWNGVVGHTYSLQFTPTLLRPFAATGPVIAQTPGVQTVSLPLPGEAGFYRVVELTP